MEHFKQIILTLFLLKKKNLIHLRHLKNSIKIQFLKRTIGLFVELSNKNNIKTILKLNQNL